MDSINPKDHTIKPEGAICTAFYNTGNKVTWTRYAKGEPTMDRTDRIIYKHWFDMFLKNHPDWKYVLSADDPFFKKGGFKVTNGKYTMLQAYPSNELHITPKLQPSATDPLKDIGLKYTSFTMESFITWAMGIEPMPEELQ